MLALNAQQRKISARWLAPLVETADASIVLLSEVDLLQHDLYQVAERLSTLGLHLHFPPPAECDAEADTKLLGAAIVVRSCDLPAGGAGDASPPATVSHDRSGRRISVRYVRHGGGASPAAAALAITALYLPTNLSQLPRAHSARAEAQRLLREAVVACDHASVAIVGGDLNESDCGRVVIDAAGNARRVDRRLPGHRQHLEQSVLADEASLSGDTAPSSSFFTYTYKTPAGDTRGSRLDRVYCSLPQKGQTRKLADADALTGGAGTSSSTDHAVIVCDYIWPAAQNADSRRPAHIGRPMLRRRAVPRFSPANCLDKSLLEFSLKVAAHPELAPVVGAQPAAGSRARAASALERDARAAQTQADLNDVQARLATLVLESAAASMPTVSDARRAQKTHAALSHIVAHAARLCDRAERLVLLATARGSPTAPPGGEPIASHAWKLAVARACRFALSMFQILSGPSARVPDLRRQRGVNHRGQRRRPKWVSGRWKVNRETLSACVPFLRRVWVALSDEVIALTCGNSYELSRPSHGVRFSVSHDALRDGRRERRHDQSIRPSASLRDALRALSRDGRGTVGRLSNIVILGAPPTTSAAVDAAKAPGRRRLADFWAGGVEARDDEARLITEPQEVAAEIAAALADKFAHPDPRGLAPVSMEADMERLYVCPGSPAQRAALERTYEREVLCDVSSDEVLELLQRKQAKADSAPGPSGLAFSLLRALVAPQRALRRLDATGERQPADSDGALDPNSKEARVQRAASDVLKAVTALLNAYLRVGDTSQHDKRSNILALAKKSTSRSTKNVRPIALLEVTGKLLSLALAKRAERVLLRENLLEVSQRGFLANRRTGDCVAYALCFLEKAAALKQEASVLCLDFRGAFDSPSRAYLRKCYAAVGFPKRLQDLLIAINAGATASVIAAGSASAPFAVERGVPQGSNLSPLLWVLAMNPLLRHLRLRREAAAARDRPQAAEGRRESGDHAYADDLLLVSTEGTQALAETAALTARWAVNTQCIEVATDADKHEALLAPRAGPRQQAQTDRVQAAVARGTVPPSIDFQLDPGTLLKVPLRQPHEAIRYLGVWLSADRSSEHEEVRISSCVRMFLHRVRCLGEGGGPFSAAAFLKTHLFPVLEQSFQSANIEERVLRALDQRLTRAFRGRLDGFGGVSRDWQRLLLRLSSFTDFYRMVRLCFVFHTLNEDSPASEMLRAEARRECAASPAARPSRKSLWHGAKVCADKLKLRLVSSKDRRAIPRQPHTAALNLTTVRLADGEGMIEIARRPNIREPANAGRWRAVGVRPMPMAVTIFTDGSFDAASGRAAAASIVLTEYISGNFRTCAATPAAARSTLARGADCPFAGFSLHNVAVNDNVVAEAFAALAGLLSLPPCPAGAAIRVRMVTDSKTLMDAYAAFNDPRASMRSRLRSQLRAVLLAIEHWQKQRPQHSVRFVHVKSHGDPKRSVEACGNALADEAAKLICAAFARGGDAVVSAGSTPAPALGWLDGHYHVVTGPDHRLGEGKHVIGDLRSFLGRESDAAAEAAAVRRDSSQSSMARAAAGLQPVLALAKVVRARMAPTTATVLHVGGLRSLAAPTRHDEKFLCFLATGRNVSATTFCTWLRGDIDKMRKLVTEDERFGWLRRHLVLRRAQRAEAASSAGPEWEWDPKCQLCRAAAHSALHFVTCRMMRTAWTDTLEVQLAAVSGTAAALSARSPSTPEVLSALDGAELCGIVKAKKLADLVLRASRLRAGGRPAAQQAGMQARRRRGADAPQQPAELQTRQVVRMLRYALLKTASQVSSRYRLLLSRLPS